MKEKLHSLVNCLSFLKVIVKGIGTKYSTGSTTSTGIVVVWALNFDCTKIGTKFVL
jgi:hypothetical protein